MLKKPHIVFPWKRVGAYLNVDPLLAMGKLLERNWTKSEEDLDTDGVAEITITCTRDQQGRVVKVARVNTRDTTKNKTVTLTYDELGRVIKCAVQDTRPITETYLYDSRDRLISETSVSIDLQGKQHTTVATHNYAQGVIVATTAMLDGKKHEEREFTPFGKMKRMTTFFDNGQIAFENLLTFNARKLLTKSVERYFTFDSESEKLRLASEVIESISYFKGSERPARNTRISKNEFEKSPGVFLLLKGLEETREFAPAGGGVEHFESRMFNPGPDNNPVEVELRIEDTTYNAQDLPVARVETRTNLSTGEKKTVKSITTYRQITVTRTDLEADGNDDEETVTIYDEAKRLVESREGKPKFGPFTRRLEYTYDDHGEEVRRVSYENNSEKPVSVLTFS